MQESYENAMTEKYGKDTSKHPIVDSGVWIKTGGENRKGRIYGIGHRIATYQRQPNCDRLAMDQREHNCDNRIAID